MTTTLNGGAREPDARPAAIGKFAYGALFIVVLPLTLGAWAARLDRFVTLPTLGSTAVGTVVAALGFTFAVWAAGALWVHGDGVPMSAYPPRRFVSQGPYRFLRHPIYLGSVLVTAGVALVYRSPAGLWIVSPFVAAICAAWVIGFEAEATRARFGAAIQLPHFRLPPRTDTAPTGWDRASAFVLVLVPWLVLYEAVELLGTPPDAVSAWQSWDGAWPVLPWTELVYALAYPVVVLAPLGARTQRDLRWFMTRGWLAMAVIFPLYLLLPIISPAKPVTGHGILAEMLRWEHAGGPRGTALPAFHAVWVFLAACVYSRRWPRTSPGWWTLAVAIAASCVTTGMHSVVDVVSAAIVFPALVYAGSVWALVRGATEWVANSWQEIELGPVRVLSHTIHVAAGLWVGLFAVIALGGNSSLPAILGISAASIGGAAVWAQVVEGSPQLLRPYGYYGGVIGAAAGLLVLSVIDADAWRLAAAFTIGGSVTQALGRGRCLVQGCCHGAACAEWLGIRYTHPRSRVTRLSGLGGVPLHPTQLYSAAWMLLVAAALFRLWQLHAGAQFIVGIYFILTGLGRFAEEHYRGEPQTVVWHGLRLYQWLAIASVVLGIVASAAGWTPVGQLVVPTGRSLLAITAFTAAAYVAYGVDFPRLNLRFSRLL